MDAPDLDRNLHELIPYLNDRYGAMIPQDELEKFIHEFEKAAAGYAYWITLLAMANVEQAFFNALDLAESQGMDPAQFNTDIETVAQNAGYSAEAPWALDTVMTSNIATAQSAGAWIAQQDMMDDYGYGMIDETGDAPCEYCALFLVDPPYIYRMDDPIWETQYGQQHPHCFRRIIGLSAADLEFFGWEPSREYPPPNPNGEDIGGMPDLEDYSYFEHAVKQISGEMGRGL